MDENNNDIRVDFRSLSDDFAEQAKDLESPDIQTDHSAMNYLRDMVHYNSFSDEERKIYDTHNYYSDNGIDLKEAYEAMQEATSGKIDKSGMEEKFYKGLMDDHRHEMYLEEKKSDPRVDAKYFWNTYCKAYEPENVKRMERAFRSIVQEPPKPKKDNTPYFSREQVENMSREEIRKNYDAIKKSEKKWK